MRTKIYTFQSSDMFKVTGVLVTGRRFKAIYTSNYWYANGINLYRGHMWLIRNNHAILIKTVYN